MAITTSAADSLEALRYAVAGGSPNLDLRLRYEDVKQDNPLDKADALTLRTRLGYTTGKWNDFDAQVELEDVHSIGDEDYNSCPGTAPPFFGEACNGNATHSVIADPTDTELNQAWLRYGGLPGTTIKYGRQRIIYDNARFIGNVGWRQNEMTYDGVSLANTFLKGFTFNYAYLSNANNIFFGDFQQKSHLVNVSYAFIPEKVVLGGYVYMLDFDQNVAARRDTRTAGLRASGGIPFDGIKFIYALEYATQEDYKDSPALVDADYYLVELGGVVSGITGKLGYEVLGSNDGLYGFQTPLATLHAFQGWADVFLNTPVTGIQDAYASLGGKAWKLNLLAVYHEYSADDGNADFGEELNLQVGLPVNDALSLTLKYADYQADTFAVDTEKLWLQADFKF
jgi:hypothetical protein